jgi:predicted transcriptional regulator
MIKQFRRVKGSGTFFLDEFCLVTGLDEAQAKECLVKAEQAGEVTVLDSIYILKPLCKPQKASKWRDWRLSQEKQERIYEAVAEGGVTTKEILERVPMGVATMQRYLSSMTQAGILRRERQGGQNAYWQGKRRWLRSTYRSYWKRVKRKRAAMASDHTKNIKEN